MAESSSMVSGNAVPTLNQSSPGSFSSSFGHPLSAVLGVKLDDKNYNLWRGMVLAILRGQRVEGYVIGKKKKPEEMIEIVTVEGRESVPNPALEEWNSIDQALCGWLFGSMSPSIAADVVDYETSAEVWKALEEFYGASSKARVNQLRSILQNTKKGSMKMNEYLTIKKQASESLKLAGNPISLDDLISFVLAGLDAEYLPVVCTIESKEFVSWLEFSSTLITFEGTIARYYIRNYSPIYDLFSFSFGLCYVG